MIGRTLRLYKSISQRKCTSTKSLGLTLLSTIVTSVKFELKLSSARLLLYFLTLCNTILFVLIRYLSVKIVDYTIKNSILQLSTLCTQPCHVNTKKNVSNMHKTRLRLHYLLSLRHTFAAPVFHKLALLVRMDYNDSRSSLGGQAGIPTWRRLHRRTSELLTDYTRKVLIDIKLLSLKFWFEIELFRSRPFSVSTTMAAITRTGKIEFIFGLLFCLLGNTMKNYNLKKS